MTTNSTTWIHHAYEQQNYYCNIFEEWRVFDREHAEYIKSTIGLLLFGIREDVEDPPPTVSYYRIYSSENRKVIETIYEHVIEKCADEVFLSCTYLIGRLENGEIFAFPVLRYSRSQFDQIYFAEVSGRYYQDWSDLVSSIQLPPCHFIAPPNGLYSSSTPIYKQFKSQAATSARKVLRIANYIASGGAVACTAATMCAFAPVTFASIGLGLSVFGVGQSVSALHDRSSHGQSIALNNRESILSYGNIVANGLAGASFAAVSNLGRLQRIFGNYASSVTTTCKVLNVSTVVFDSSFLLINAYDFITKLRDGTVTSHDVFDLSLQIFLVCGAVVQARDMHRLINQSKSSPTGIAKKLTKTQKRNLQKRRAKARARGEELPIVSSQLGENTLTVGENDLYSSMKMFSLRVGSFGVNVMMAMYPRAEIILNYYYDLRDLIHATFVRRTMELKVFFQQIFYQTRNLYTIIRRDIARMKEILGTFIPDPIINNNETIAQIVNNELDYMYQAAEEIMPTSEVDISEDNNDTSEDQSTLILETKENMILKYVHKVCSKYRIKDTADAQISFFHTILVFTTNYVAKNSVQLFDQVFERSNTIVGEEKGRKMASVLGIRTQNDFYPTNNFMEKVLENTDTALKEFMENYNEIEYEEDTCSSLAQEVFEMFRHLLSQMNANVIKQSRMGEVGIICLTRTLAELSVALHEKLYSECRKISFDSRSLYEENVAILGQTITEGMMKSIEMPTTESGFFQSALKLLNIDDITSKVKFKYNNFDESIQATYSRSTEQLKENSHEHIIIELIGNLYERIKKRPESTRWFESKCVMFKTITAFVGEKLVTELKLDKKLCDELKSNEGLIGPELLKLMFEAIGKCPSEKFHLFRTKAQILQSEHNLENMIAEFSSRYRHVQTDLQQPKIFDTTTGDDGFITYKITCDRNGTEDSYKELIHLLFGFKVNEFDFRIQRDKRSVVVKSRNKVIVFTFPSEENEALVILTDLEYLNEKESIN